MLVARVYLRENVRMPNSQFRERLSIAGHGERLGEGFQDAPCEGIVIPRALFSEYPIEDDHDLRERQDAHGTSDGMDLDFRELCRYRFPAKASDC